MSRATRLEIAMVVLVLAASLSLRLAGLNVFVAPDEMRWTCRSLEFRDALRRGDWKDTFRVGHPGVLTTWTGALFIPREDDRALATCQATSDAQRLLRAGDTVEERAVLLAELRQMLSRGRVGVALLTGLCIAGVYSLVRLLWGPRIAVVSLLLVALDPFYLALSRFLHVDALLTSVMILSMLSLLASTRRPRRSRGHLGLLALSGVMGGLTALQKTPGGFVAPFAVLVLAAIALRRGLGRRALTDAFFDLLVWGLIAGATYVAFWPAMWVDPLGTVRKVLDKAIGYAVEGHENDLYFLGRPVHDPGWGFYPVATLFRLSPWTLGGLVACLYWLMAGRERAGHRLEVILLLLQPLFFGILMSLGVKKFDRYFLPAFPALDIVGAVGIVGAVDGLRARLNLRASRDALYGPALACWILLIAQATLVLPHHPYYLTYYNPLLGGLRQAQRVLLVGWGEGYDEAAAYLHARPEAQNLQVVAPSVSAFAPLFRGDAQNVTDYSVWRSDYVLFYISHVQRRRYEDVMAEYFFNPEMEPEKVITLHGVDYVWIYRNTSYVEPLAYVNENGQPRRDCLLADGDTLFTRYYEYHEGGLPLYEFPTHWSPGEMSASLDGLPDECERLWYVRYPAAASRLGDLLAQRGLELSRASFPHVEAILYRPIEKEEPELELLSGDVRFGDLQLRGYGVTDPAPAWGRDGGVFLAWEALGAPEEDYVAFVHVYDGHGNRIAQEDRRITDAHLRPTSQWESGTSGRVLHHLSIPPGTPPGRYAMEVGVYVGETGERLPLLNPQGEETAEKTIQLEIEIDIPRSMPKVTDLHIPSPSAREIGPQLRLLGYDLEDEALLVGQPVTLRLFWQALAEMEEAYRLQAGLRGSDGRVYGQREIRLTSTDYSTDQWRAGEILQQIYELPTDERMPTGEAVVEITLLDEAGRPLLAEPMAVTRLWVQSMRPSFEIPGRAHVEERCQVNLGDRVTLLGYTLGSGPIKPGEDVSLTVYWQARREMDVNYKVFLHMYDEEGNIIGQRDRVPGLGARPTTDWEPGEVLADRYSVAVDAGVPAGSYRLAMGMYDGASGERLPAFGSDGERLDQDRFFLGEVEVGPR